MKMATYESGATLPPRRKIKEEEKRMETIFEHFKRRNCNLNDCLETIVTTLETTFCNSFFSLIL